MPMEGARPRIIHCYKVLTQGWRRGASRFSYSVFHFLRLSRSVELALLFTGRYISRDEARFHIPHGCACDLLLVLGLEKPTFQNANWGSTCGGISALARGYSHGVALFQNLDGLLDSFTFFVSQNRRSYLVVWHRLTVELVRQGPLKVSGP